MATAAAGRTPPSTHSFSSFASGCQVPPRLACVLFYSGKQKINLLGPRSTSFRRPKFVVQCKATEISAAESGLENTASTSGVNWTPIIPVTALPRGERRLIRQDGETILLLWYKDNVFAIENKSPAEGAYTEGFIDAKLTADGCIVCPSTASTFDLGTGQIKEWYPTNPILRFVLQPLRQLVVYTVKVESEYIYIDMRGRGSGEAAEIVFSGKTQAGRTVTNIDTQEVKMEVDESSGGFGFTSKNEVINGRAAAVGLFLVLIQELLTGKGFLKGIGFLDFLYQYLK